MQHDPTEIVESRRAGTDHGPEDLGIVFPKLSVPGAVSQDSCEDSQHAACCLTLLTHRVDRFGDATDGRHVGPRASRADPSAPRPNRYARMPCQPPIFAHVFAKPAPHRHAMLVPRPNPAQNPAIPRPVRNAGYALAGKGHSRVHGGCQVSRQILLLTAIWILSSIISY